MQNGPHVTCFVAYFTFKTNHPPMKNTILRYGLIAGSILAVLLLVTTLVFKYIGFDKVGFENSAYFGYASMVAAMSVIYFAIKSYRDQHLGGSIGFGRALVVGLGIAGISCVIYSLCWLVIYYNFIPTFMDDYAAFCVQKAQATGATQAELDKSMADINQMKEWYKNPFLIFAITLLEPTPVGLLVSLVSAGVLRKK
jgi:hypothetical protein